MKPKFVITIAGNVFPPEMCEDRPYSITIFSDKNRVVANAVSLSEAWAIIDKHIDPDDNELHRIAFSSSFQTKKSNLVMSAGRVEMKGTEYFGTTLGELLIIIFQDVEETTVSPIMVILE